MTSLATVRNAICALACTSVTLYAGITIRPQGPVVVPVGSAVQFKANADVRWSLEPGSAGEIDRDGVYHAPNSIRVNNSLGGCQVLPNDHIYNTRIDTLPLDPNSPSLMSLIPPSSISYFEGWGINIGNHSTPTKKMHFFYTPHHDGSFELMPWPELKRQTGALTDPSSGEDRHEFTVDRDTCRFYELYNVYTPGVNKSCPTCTAQSGIQYSGMDAALQEGSVDAAGLLIMPLTVSLGEIRSGAVRHALRVTFSNNIISPSSAWPSRSHAGAWGHIPYGTRLRLRSSYDISNFSDTAKVLLTQLQQYGLMIADGGPNWAISASTDVTMDPVVVAAFEEVARKGPHTADFEIVDESPLAVSPDSGLVNPESGHVKPDSFATVVATDSQGKTAKVRILLQGVTVGVPDPSVWIQSGVTQQLAGWVNGAQKKGLTWTMSPEVGSLTPDGQYTAPDVSRPAHTTITASSVADPDAKAQIDLTVMPPGPIRVKIGNATTAAGAPNHYAPDYGPDSEGHMWWRDQAGEVSWGMVYDDYGVKWPAGKDIPLYYTSRYSLGDMVYKFFVPNGRYKITLLFAQRGELGKLDTYPIQWRAPIDLEAQGNILVKDYDMGAGIDHATKTPVSESMPAEVSDQSLYFALRRLSAPGNIKPSPMLNGYVIEKDDAPPHVSIIPHEVPILHINEQIQFKTIGWHMPASVKWSVVKGRGTISDTGLYTAPSEPPATDEKIVIQARSAADPSKVATDEITMQPGSLSITPDSAAIDYSLSQKFQATLSGVPYSNVKWSVSPDIGSINSDGVFTAPDQVKRDTVVIVKAESKLFPGRSASATVRINASAAPIRVVCGPPRGFKDAKGNVWSDDFGYSGQTIAYSVSMPIPRARPDLQRVYQSSRYVYDNGRFSYNFAVPNGRYHVKLLFCDYAFNDPGHHSFDVKLNGEQVLTNFDPNAVYGSKAAVDKEFDVTVQDRAVHIDFIGHKGGATINGIEIIPAG